MTIAAGDARMEHFALHEGAVLVVLLLYLAVREVAVFIKQRDAIVVAHRLSVHVVFVNLAAPRVASRARFDFLLRLTRRASTRVASRWIDRPRDAFALIECDRQSLSRIEPLPI